MKKELNNPIYVKKLNERDIKKRKKELKRLYAPKFYQLIQKYKEYRINKLNRINFQKRQLERIRIKSEIVDESWAFYRHLPKDEHRTELGIKLLAKIDKIEMIKAIVAIAFEEICQQQNKNNTEES